MILNLIIYGWGRNLGYFSLFYLALPLSLTALPFKLIYIFNKNSLIFESKMVPNLNKTLNSHLKWRFCSFFHLICKHGNVVMQQLCLEMFPAKIHQWAGLYYKHSYSHKLMTLDIINGVACTIIVIMTVIDNSLNII